MTAYEGGDNGMFSICCNGSYLPGPVVTMELSSTHDIDDAEPVVLWEQGQGDWR